MDLPCLNEIELKEVIKALGNKIEWAFIVTKSIGQWDELLSCSYDLGAILLEVNDDGIPINAYQKSLQ